jgi:hypothetical protein
MSQKQLNALRDHGIPAGKVLKAWRSKAVKRKRLKMKIKKAIALEAHELQQMARENATLAMQTLISISKNERAPEATRIAASQVILDRAYGKASQTSITASVTNGKADTIDGGELDKRVARALKRVEELTDRTPKAPTSQKRPSNLTQVSLTSQVAPSVRRGILIMMTSGPASICSVPTISCGLIVFNKLKMEKSNG